MTVPHSYSIQVRDGMLDRVKVMPFFSNFKFASNVNLSIQPDSVPFCGVYLISETMMPDGDANAAEVRFRTSARIGFSVIVQNNNSEVIEYQLDAAYQTIMSNLLSDFTLYNNNNFKIQGFTQGSRQHVFGAIGKDNELPVAELRLELLCDLGAITFPPTIVDDLETIHVTTQYPPGAGPEVQRIESEYDLPQN
jgi:hypothetical protein